MADFKVVFQGREFADVGDGMQQFFVSLRQVWDGSAKELKMAMTDYLLYVAAELEQKHSGSWPSGTTGTSLSKRTGSGIESIIHSIKVEGRTLDTLRGFISAPGYMSIHEYGGTMTGKGKLLTIPLPAALDSRGVPIKRSAREWDNTFVTKTRAGNLVIMQKRLSQVVPLYVLKESVTIPPRLGLQDELKADVPYFLPRAIDAMVAAMTKGM